MNSVAADISPAGEIQTLLASRVPLVVIESREEARVIELVRDAAMRAQRGRNWGVFQWTVTEGLMSVDVNMGGAQRTLAQPDQLLRHIKSTNMPGIYVLLDFHPYLENPLFVRTLKDIAQEYDKCARTLVLISFEMKLPQELEHLAGALRVRLPDKNERHMIVMRTAREWAKLNGVMPASTSRQWKSWSTTSPGCRCTTYSDSRARRSSTTVHSPRMTSSRCWPRSTSC